MTIKQMQEGYEKEVAYQKHMLRNLGYWFQLFFIISACGLVLIYYFKHSTFWLFVIGIVLMLVGCLGMLIFSYASWRGRQNVELIIQDYQQKISQIKEFDKNSLQAEKILLQKTK